MKLTGRGFAAQVDPRPQDQPVFWRLWTVPTFHPNPLIHRHSVCRCQRPKTETGLPNRPLLSGMAPCREWCTGSCSSSSRLWLLTLWWGLHT